MVCPILAFRNVINKKTKPWMRWYGYYTHSELIKGCLTSMHLILEISLNEISICFLLTKITRVPRMIQQHKKFILQYLFILYPLRKINIVWGHEEQKKKHTWKLLTRDFFFFLINYIYFFPFTKVYQRMPQIIKSSSFFRNYSFIIHSQSRPPIEKDFRKSDFKHHTRLMELRKTTRN